MKTKYCFTPLSQTSALLIAVSSIISIATAAPIIYEGFDGYATGLLSGQSVNGNATGLSGSYATVSANNANIISTSLSFGSGATMFATQGGALEWTAATTGGVGIGLNIPTHTGTLYGGYLLNLGASSTGNGARLETRFNSAITGFTGDAFLDASAVGLSSSTTIAIKYGVGGSTATAASLLAANTTYLALTKWTGVGGAGSGTVWFLNSSQWDAMMAGGNLNETYLNNSGNVTQTLTGGNSTTALSSTRFLQFIMGNTSGSASRTIDEVRYGASLADVVAVPEPTSAAILAATAGLFVTFRRRS